MVSTRRIPFRTLHLAVLVAVLLAGCDGGGGSGDAGGPVGAGPQFDLTGTWSMGEPTNCEFVNQTGLYEALLGAALDSPEFVGDDLGGDLEGNGDGLDLSAVTGDEFHIAQTGSDLAVTYEDDDGTEVRVHGTLSGDQVRFIQSEERALQTLSLDVYTEVSGTVLDDDRMALRQESEWSVRIPGGESVTGTVDCSFRATRI